MRDLFFTRTHLQKYLGDLFGRQLAAGVSQTDAHGRLNGIDQRNRVDGLLQKVQSACFERGNGCFHIGVASDENDGQMNALLFHEALQLHAAHVRHTDVQKQTSGNAWGILGEKVARRTIGTNLPSLAFQHEAQCVADVFIIVNDTNDGALANIG